MNSVRVFYPVHRRSAQLYSAPVGREAEVCEEGQQPLRPRVRSHMELTKEDPPMAVSTLYGTALPSACSMVVTKQPFPDLSSLCLLWPIHFQAPFLPPSLKTSATAHSFTVGGPFVFHVLCTGVPVPHGIAVSPLGDWVSEDDLEYPNSKGIQFTLNCLKFP